jgi:hypothetical protein
MSSRDGKSTTFRPTTNEAADSGLTATPRSQALPTVVAGSWMRGRIGASSDGLRSREAVVTIRRPASVEPYRRHPHQLAGHCTPHRSTVGGRRNHVYWRIVISPPTQKVANEIPQAANRVVGCLEYHGCVADRTVHSQL